MPNLDLFDIFASDSDEMSSKEITERSIRNNICDIIQNRSYIGRELLPFSFGIPDITGRISELSNNNKLADLIKSRIEMYEKRITKLQVKFITNIIGEPCLYINCFYSFDGETSRLDFNIAL